MERPLLRKFHLNLFSLNSVCEGGNKRQRRARKRQ
jgi:hypothetical protein